MQTIYRGSSICKPSAKRRQTSVEPPAIPALLLSLAARRMQVEEPLY